MPDTNDLFSMKLDGYAVRQPFSGFDLEVVHPSGKRSHLYPVYDAEYAYSHEATMERAMRFIAVTQLRTVTRQ